MGTVITIDVFPLPAASGDGWDADLQCRLARARAVLKRADEVFSTWRADSPVTG